MLLVGLVVLLRPLAALGCSWGAFQAAFQAAISVVWRKGFRVAVWGGLNHSNLHISTVLREAREPAARRERSHNRYDAAVDYDRLRERERERSRSRRLSRQRHTDTGANRSTDSGTRRRGGGR